jgi:hypothetical protein
VSTGGDKTPPQADFVYYAIAPVSRLNARQAMDGHPESCVCVLVGGNFGLIPLSQLRALVTIAERSK